MTYKIPSTRRAVKQIRAEEISVSSLLIENNYVAIPNIVLGKSRPSQEVAATVFANLAYYGYVLSTDAVKALMKLSDAEVTNWWLSIKDALAEITGENRKMGDHVVYKNFPQEVLDMTQGEYWFNQILMYIGFPNEWFAQPRSQRPELKDKVTLKVLHLASDVLDTVRDIFETITMSKVSLNQRQLKRAYFILENYGFKIDADRIPFKENLVLILKKAIELGRQVALKTATDIMRLAIVLSGGELNSTKPVKFGKVSKPTRRWFLDMLEQTTNLQDDVARDTEKWKKFLRPLHAGDYKNKYPKVCFVVSKLYNDDIQSFAGKVEVAISKKDVAALTLLETRPGELVRRLNQLVLIYGSQAVESYAKVASKLTINQLIKIRKYLETYFDKTQRLILPKSNWTKAKIFDIAGLPRMTEEQVTLLNLVTIQTLSTKINEVVVDGVILDKNTENIKLSASDVAAYGRGTSFAIPANIEFVRTASYWEYKGFGSNWFDNGWNFFDEDWAGVGTISWDNPKFGNSALFSGDPTNTKTKDGKACQLIDLNLNRLEREGVRYAVWSVLCYSKIKFSDATDVFAALQFLEDAKAGELFEPSRAQLAFPLKDNAFSKFVAYIDVKERKLVFLDVTLKCEVSSATRNLDMLSKTMPAVSQYLDTLPSVYDVFDMVDEGTTQIAYSDKEITLEDKAVAYVFKPENETNSFTQINIHEILGQ
jgi:hypothetical protein